MSGKTLLIADDENEADSNPFSFRHFLRATALDPDEDRGPDQAHRRAARVISVDPAEAGGLRSMTSPVTLSVQESVLAMQGRDHREPSSFMPEPEALPSCRQIQQLQQENRTLRGIITDLETKLQEEAHRAAQLSQQLSEQQRREEKEAGALEHAVQSVEQNLDQMTKRAKKSEHHVTRLKSEVKQLQTQVRSLQLDNDRLKSSHSDVVMAMRHNTHLASEYLTKTVSHAHSSLRRLQDETETLQLISQLLQSIDRISEVDPPSHTEHTHTA